MIIHDCLNIFIKNLTVILISSLYLTKFIISTLAKKCVIRPNLYEKWAHVRKSKYQFIHDIRLATWWCMVLFNFQHFKIDGFHSVHGPFSMTLTYSKKMWTQDTSLANSRIDMKSITIDSIPFDKTCQIRIPVNQ